MASSAVIEIGLQRVQFMAPGTRLAVTIILLPHVVFLDSGGHAQFAVAFATRLARGRDRDLDLELPSVVMELMNHGGRTSVGLTCMWLLRA